MPNTISILDANPLEHITGDIAQSNYNYQSILNGLVEWETTRNDTVTIRLATNTEPFFVDYTIRSKYSYDSGNGMTISAPTLAPGHYAFRESLAFSAMFDPERADVVNLRIAVKNAGGVDSRLYAMAAVYNETAVAGRVFVQNDTYGHSYESGLYFKRSVVTANIPYVRLCKTIAKVSKGDSIVFGANCIPMVVEYGSSEYNVDNILSHGQHVIYDGKVYVAAGDIVRQYTPDNPASGFAILCDVYSDTSEYAYGSYVFHDGQFFVHSSDTSSKGIAPSTYDPASREITYFENYWTPVYFIDTLAEVNNGGVARYTVPTDISGFVLRNVGSEDAGDGIDIKLTTTLKVAGRDSRQSSGVNIIKTANYAQWPMNSVKWTDGKTYGPTDASRGIYSLQDYSAVMVFNHADENTKKLNIVSYDGPDLDQGLAIFLPVSVSAGDGSVREPEDGYMFEFMFRIWPNPSLNGNSTNDLIVNKAQIYVYNIGDYTDFDWSNRDFDKNNVYPIARFSMARLTNFYVFAENIGVPDRPVVYKARFIYSKREHRWKTFDYYQFPDHVFMSPAGFIDPMAGDNAYPGVETGGFPLFQDPFAGTDLSPVRMTSEYVAHVLND